MTGFPSSGASPSTASHLPSGLTANAWSATEVSLSRPAGLPVPALQTPTLMADAAGRLRVARETLRFAAGLAR